MKPTLLDGQRVLVIRGADRVKKGDVVLFTGVDGLTVKRYVLTGNDTPLIDHGWLVTPWGKWFLTKEEWQVLLKNHQLAVNGPDSYFMVGDNQFNSLDSRTWGYVDKKRIIGRVVIRRSGNAQ